MFWRRKLTISQESVVQLQGAYEALRVYSKRLETRIEDLEGDLSHVREQLHKYNRRINGQAGGRPVRPGVTVAATSDLDSIPKGDKAALREFFAPELARRGPGARFNSQE